MTDDITEPITTVETTIATPSPAVVAAVPRARRRPLRALRRVALVIVLAAAAASIGYVVNDKDDASSAPAPVVLKTATVTSGTLSTVEKVDGSLELSNSMKVLHRIEGQTSSATASNGASTGASTAAGPAGGGASASAVAAGGLIAGIIADARAITRSDLACAAVDDTTPTTDPVDCETTTSGPPATDAPTTDAPATTATTTTTDEPTTAATTTDAPTTSAATSAVPTTSTATSTATTVATSSPSSSSTSSPPTTSSSASTTAPVAPTSTSAPTDATSTTVSGGARVGGPSGGGGLGGGAATGGGASGGSSTSRITQTVTSVIADGASVGLGDVLYTVDSQPVVALSGVLPAWRSLSTSSDDGPDIQQLENSLVSLGYDPDATVVVDNAFDAKTKAMVERWQEGLGIEATGTVELGSVVFLPTTTTVSNVSAKVGDLVGDGDTIVTLAAATQDVVIDVPDGDESFVVPGLEVTLGTATGTISLLRSVERDGAVVVQAVITPSAPIEGVANGATISVTITRDALPGDAANVLIAPAEALLSHIDGTYAVQVQGADGVATWHTVELLAVSGNKVAIRGDGIADGTLVLVPV